MSTDALLDKKIFEEDKVRKRILIRFICWKSDLSAYDITFVHRKGSTNIADYLSIKPKKLGHGIVLRNDVIVIPSQLQQNFIDYAHEGHIGLKLCKRLLKKICWFPEMDQMIENTMKSKKKNY